MKADQILRAGLDTLVARGVKRDQPDGERSMPRIVRVFEAITGIRLTEREGLLFMVSMKLVREGRGAPDADDYIDLANYVALCGEAALATGKDSLPVHAAPSVVNEQLTTAETAHAELQDLLAQRAAQLGPVVTVRPCKACDGTGNCAINRDRYNTPCPACNGTGHRQFMEAACSAT
jgi:hypothetical protein